MPKIQYRDKQNDGQVVELEVTNPGDLGDIHFRGPAGMTALPAQEFLDRFEQVLQPPPLAPVRPDVLPSISSSRLGPPMSGDPNAAARPATIRDRVDVPGADAVDRVIAEIRRGFDRVVEELRAFQPETNAEQGKPPASSGPTGGSEKTS